MISFLTDGTGIIIKSISRTISVAVKSRSLSSAGAEGGMESMKVSMLCSPLVTGGSSISRCFESKGNRVSILLTAPVTEEIWNLRCSGPEDGTESIRASILCTTLVMDEISGARGWGCEGGDKSFFDTVGVGKTWPGLSFSALATLIAGIDGAGIVPTLKQVRNSEGSFHCRDN